MKKNRFQIRTSILKNRDETKSIYFGKEIFGKLNEFISQQQYSSSKLFILVDENVEQHCLPVLLQHIEKLKQSSIIQIKSGEGNKNIFTCVQLWNKLIELNADRKSLLINLGGGMLSDLGGFAASTFKRGIDFINIPTTLLAQVDASIGGKTGVNLNSLKNQIGTFSNPKAIFIYSGFLKTLPKKQFLSGFAEIIKHALIADANYWQTIRQTKISATNKDLAEIIFRSVKIKNQIVSKDPFEKAKRKFLNFGHTIGHAIETFSLEYDKNLLLHGEAIAAGMICESYLSFKKTRLSEKQLNDITSFIKSKYSLRSFSKTQIDTLLQLMISDKKNEKGKINFTLLKNIGEPVINCIVGIELVKDAMSYYNGLLHTHKEKVL